VAPSCAKDKKGYVLAVPVNFRVRLPSGRKATVAAVARLVPAAAWETRSCEPGCKGRRGYAWAWAATASPRHWVLIRRSLSDPSDLAFFYCHAPEGRLVSLPVLISVAGKRWPVEECVQQGKSTLGLTAAKVRDPGQADRWARLIMAAHAQLLLARPLADDLRRPWEKHPDPARPLTPGRVRRGFRNIRRELGTPARVAKPSRPGPGRPKGSSKGPAPRHLLPGEAAMPRIPNTTLTREKVKT